MKEQLAKIKAEQKPPPRLTVEAEVVTKRIDVTHHHDTDDMAMSHTTAWHYVTFQGTRCLDFERQRQGVDHVP